RELVTGQDDQLHRRHASHGRRAGDVGQKGNLPKALSRLESPDLLPATVDKSQHLHLAVHNHVGTLPSLALVNDLITWFIMRPPELAGLLGGQPNDVVP